MRILVVSLVACSLLSSASFAGNHKDKHRPGAKPPGLVGHCPPGLAKKNPPCIPPGQAKKRYPDGYLPFFRVGDTIYSDYRILQNPRRYGLDDGLLYYIVGREVFRVSPETGRVLAFIGLTDWLLN